MKESPVSKSMCERLFSPVIPLGGAVLVFVLASCATQQDSADIDGPIWGSSHPTKYVVGTDGAIRVRDLAKVARILRHYKTLDAAERALVKSSVAKRLQGIIALEIERSEARHRVERAEIARLPDRAVAERRRAALDETVRREAMAAVVQRLGNLVAVPLKTSDNRSAVAFARLGDRGIDVVADAGEVDRPIASLTDGDAVQTEGGRVAAFIGAQPVAVAKGR